MILTAYKKTVVAEVDLIINRLNNEVIYHMLEGPLEAKKAPNWIFFKKLQADYYRYGAEMSPHEEVDDARRYYREKAREAYVEAQTKAENEARERERERHRKYRDFCLFRARKVVSLPL